jgi:putative transferase (TIGR04331 family)
MFLATTANQNFWNKDDDILFLGEWCKLYKESDTWKKLKFSDLEYHWNDNKRFENDFIYLDNIYEQYLKELTYNLNKIHNVNYSDRYWRIVIGVWLKAFIDSFFDRYLSIKEAKRSNLVTNTWIKATNKKPPVDFPSFSHDDYNLYLYSYIIEYLKPFPYEYKDFDNDTKHDNSVKVSTVGRIYREINRQLHKGFETFTRQAILVLIVEIYPYLIRKIKSDVVFCGKVYMSIRDSIMMQLSFKQLPFVYHGRKNKNKINIPNYKIREKFFFKKRNIEFESLLSEILPNQIPMLYIENYRTIHKEIINTAPATPKLILTAFSINYRRCFEFWSAYHMEKNQCKIAISQHGGGYGIGKCMALDRHLIKAFDRYYTWGANCWHSNKVKPMPSLRLHYTKQRLNASNNNGPIMWIATTQARYKTIAEHGLTGPHMIEYFKMQEDFYKNTCAKAKDLLLWRYCNEPWDDKERMMEFAPNLKVQKGLKDQMGKKSDFITNMKKCRLAIHTANETTYIEALSSNFPSIIFWDPERFVIHDELQYIFDFLEGAEILHYSSISASNKVNEIYQNPLEWWKSDKVQRARVMFCNALGMESDSIISDWSSEITKLKNCQNVF